ncbi:MAG: M20/M25/M40 family metallo-hydrolase [Saprospiraceae bacterium]
MIKQLVFSFVVFVAGLSVSTLQAQKIEESQLPRLAAAAAEATLEEFKECLALANDTHYPDEVESNVVWSEKAFAKRGLSTKRLDTGGPPLVLGTLDVDAGLPTVLFYIQLDGQPVDSAFWYQPTPYTATLKKEVLSEGWVSQDWSALDKNWSANAEQLDWRVFARSTSDAKGPVLMFLAAMDVMNERKQTPKFNIKVIMDFEEEIGSPHLPAAVEKYREELAADHFVILDGPMHPSNTPTLAFGARGICKVTLEVFGPRMPQHSGHYGNFVSNPAWDLVRLLAPLKDDKGVVQLDGWYDGIDLDPKTLAILNAVPDDVDGMRTRFLVGRFDSVANSLQEAIQYPSLNIRGMGSAWIRDEVRTIIPSTAVAEIDIRTVVESQELRLLDLLKAYVEDQGFYVVDGRSPTAAERLSNARILRWDAKASYKAFRTELDSPTGVWLTDALRGAFGKDPIRIRTMGGSIPISPFVSTLGVPAVSIPTVNSDNNQHSPNENIRLGNYVDGIRSVLAVLISEAP